MPLNPDPVIFRAVVSTIVPEAAVLDESGWRDVLQVIESLLRDRPESLKRQIRIFLRAIEWLPVVRYGRPVHAPRSEHPCARPRPPRKRSHSEGPRRLLGTAHPRAGGLLRPAAGRPGHRLRGQPARLGGAPVKRVAYDIAIVGSGAGGGTVAQELSPLCRQGLRIAVLEKGPRLRDEEFTGRELEMAGALYEDGGGFLTADGAMTIAFGCAYGGSTVVYTGTSMLPPERVIRRWDVPGLTHADLDCRARKFMAENNVHLLADDLDQREQQAVRGRLPQAELRCAAVPGEHQGLPRISLCNLGCPNQAKQGTDRVQLPRAEANGVEVVTRCQVLTVGEKTLAVRVAAKPAGAKGDPSPWEPGDYQIDAKIVVLCAGAVNTPALLLRSGMERRLPRLGYGFTTHPAFIIVGEQARPITNFVVFPKAITSTSSPKAAISCSKPACIFRLSRPRAWRVSARRTAPSCGPSRACR